MSITVQSITPTRTFTSAALTAELGRRRKNKGRDTKVRAKGFVLPALSKADMTTIKAGGFVTVTFGTGRVEIVGLNSN